MAEAAIPPRLLSTQDAAAYLGISTDTLKARVPVPPLKLSAKCIRYDRLALDAWLDGKSPSAPDRPKARSKWKRLRNEGHGEGH